MSIKSNYFCRDGANYKEQLEKSALLAIQQLRKQHHAQGFPFMINAPDLPQGHCYLEYPDGTIKYVRLNRSIMDFEMVRELSAEEEALIKKVIPPLL